MIDGASRIVATGLLSGVVGGTLGFWLNNIRSRRPRYVAVVVGRHSGTAAPLEFMTFRELHVAQEWCRRMNVAQDSVASLDTRPPGRMPTYFDVRALPFRPEREGAR